MKVAWERFAAAIRHKRRTHEMSIRAVAEKIGLSHMPVARAEQACEVDTATFLFLCKGFLKMDPRRFVD